MLVAVWSTIVAGLADQPEALPAVEADPVFQRLIEPVIVPAGASIRQLPISIFFRHGVLVNREIRLLLSHFVVSRVSHRLVSV